MDFDPLIFPVHLLSVKYRSKDPSPAEQLADQSQRPPEDGVPQQHSSEDYKRFFNKTEEYERENSLSNNLLTPSRVQQNLRDFIYVPRRAEKGEGRNLAKIPCLLLTHSKSCKLMLYFHGNGEDLMMSQPQLEYIRMTLNINILAMEYPQYERNYLGRGPGVYVPPVSVEQILEDCLDVYQVIHDECEIPNSDLIIYGSSIGTGFALQLSVAIETRQQNIAKRARRDSRKASELQNSTKQSAECPTKKYPEPANSEMRTDQLVVETMASTAGDDPKKDQSICCLLLMSPFLSIRQLARDLIDAAFFYKKPDFDHPEKTRPTKKRRCCSFSLKETFSGVLSWLVRDRLNSETAITHVHCPTFIVHGLRDTMVPYTHAKRLHELCGVNRQASLEPDEAQGSSGTECSLLISSTMTHNEYDIDSDFVDPIKNFFSTNRITHKIEARRQLTTLDSRERLDTTESQTENEILFEKLKKLRNSPKFQKFID